jgi:hypothetical protein
VPELRNKEGFFYRISFHKRLIAVGCGLSYGDAITSGRGGGGSVLFVRFHYLC